MCRYTVDERAALCCGESAVKATSAIAQLLEAARPFGIPIIYSTQRTEEPYSAATGGRLIDKAIPDDSNFAQEMWPHEILDEVGPMPEDTVLVKPKPSVFFGTQLASILIYHNVDTLIVTGTTTAGCIWATVDHAAAYNFRVIVPQECVADRFQLSHETALFNMDAFLADVMPLVEVLDYLKTVDPAVYS
jgi:nicotinamidase-related amidase